MLTTAPWPHLSDHVPLLSERSGYERALDEGQFGTPAGRTARRSFHAYSNRYGGGVDQCSWKPSSCSRTRSASKLARLPPRRGKGWRNGPSYRRRIRFAELFPGDYLDSLIAAGVQVHVFDPRRTPAGHAHEPVPSPASEDRRRRRQDRIRRRHQLFRRPPRRLRARREAGLFGRVAGPGCRRHRPLVPRPDCIAPRSLAPFRRSLANARFRIPGGCCRPLRSRLRRP